MLIVLEGLDGAGKSTQVIMLDKYLQDARKKTKYLHFPRYETAIYGDLIARFLRGDFGSNDEVHPQLVALLFALDRSDAAKDIRQWLSDGYCVILDRYVYSNIGFQCAKLTNSKEAAELRDWIFNYEYNICNIPKPDLNLFLDVPVDFVDEQLKRNRCGSDRNYLEGKSDIHEASIAFQMKVRATYLEQCEKDKDFIRIDCSCPSGKMLEAEVIFEKIKQQIAEKIK